MPRQSTLAPLVLAAVLAAAGTAPAQAFLAANDMVVSESGNGLIEVPWRGQSGASYFWCAVGDYVIRGLGMSPATLIWRVSAPPRRSGEGVAFSLSPERSAGRTGLVQLSDDGSLTAGHAKELCNQERMFDAE